MSEQVIVLGSGGHARSIIDSVIDCDAFDVAGVVSPSESDWEPYRGVRWIGADAAAQSIYHRGCRAAVMGIGYMGGPTKVREKLYEEYAALGFSFPSIIDPSAQVSQGARIHEGVFVGKNAIVNANAQIGRFSIINSAALVEHDCVVGEFSHIAVAAVLCGGVHVGSNVLVGANATVIQGTYVDDQSVIGAGAIVLKNVGQRARIVGTYRGED